MRDLDSKRMMVGSSARREDQKIHVRVNDERGASTKQIDAVVDSDHLPSGSIATTTG